MLKRFALPLVVFMLVFSFVAPVSADNTPPPATLSSNGQLFGIVPIHQGGSSATNVLGVGKLTYHGGPIMRTNKVYAIFWKPAGYSVNSSYNSLINRYFTDVAAASGATTNVYKSSTQYFSNIAATKTYIINKSTFGGSFLDTHAYPANGCPLYNGLQKCLTDAQIKAEIARVIAAKGWVANQTTMFFIFTANQVGSCFDGSGTQCAFTAYCGYHSASGNMIYSNMPYAGTSLVSCGVPYTPNGNAAADSTLSVVSHEHLEAITDPRLNAWYDSVGYENGDKCAWTFGAVSAAHKFNQTINGHKYILQAEWSNKTNQCVFAGQ